MNFAIFISIVIGIRYTFINFLPISFFELANDLVDYFLRYNSGWTEVRRQEKIKMIRYVIFHVYIYLKKVIIYHFMYLTTVWNLFRSFYSFIKVTN